MELFGQLEGTFPVNKGEIGVLGREKRLVQRFRESKLYDPTNYS